MDRSFRIDREAEVCGRFRRETQPERPERRNADRLRRKSAEDVAHDRVGGDGDAAHAAGSGGEFGDQRIQGLFDENTAKLGCRFRRSAGGDDPVDDIVAEPALGVRRSGGAEHCAVLDEGGRHRGCADVEGEGGLSRTGGGAGRSVAEAGFDQQAVPEQRGIRNFDPSLDSCRDEPAGVRLARAFAVRVIRLPGNGEPPGEQPHPAASAAVVAAAAEVEPDAGFRERFAQMPPRRRIDVEAPAAGIHMKLHCCSDRNVFNRT